MGVFLRHLDHLAQQPVGQRDRIEPEREELVVLHDQLVLVGLLARVGQVHHLGPGQPRHQSRKIAHPMCFGHLVEDLHPLASLGRIRQRQLDAAHAILDMDEGPRLPARAMHGQRIADRRLNEEAVQHGAVIAVVIETVDQLFVPPGLVGMGAPDDALMQVGDPECVILGIELEHDLIEAFGHVIDRAGPRRVKHLLGFLAGGGVDLDIQIAFGDRRTDAGIAIDAHRAEMDQMRVDAGFHQSRQHVMRRIGVVVDGIDLVAVGFHRIGRGALFGEMDHRVGLHFREPLLQTLEFLRQIQQVKMDLPAGFLFPDPAALLNRIHWGQRLHAQFGVDPAAREVVDDMNLVPQIGQMKRSRPADKAVATKNRNTHEEALPYRMFRPRWPVGAVIRTDE